MRNFCCSADTFLLWPEEGKPQGSHNVGRCLWNNHRTYWNEEVSKYARTTSGLLITISPAAQDAIRKKYNEMNGQPLFVHTAKGCCDCGAECSAFCAHCCDDCMKRCCCCCECCRNCNCNFCDSQQCFHYSQETMPVEGIWYGKQDAPTKMRVPVIHLFCIPFRFANRCMQPTIVIEPSDFRLVELSNIQPIGDGATATAELVEVQPQLIISETMGEKLAKKFMRDGSMSSAVGAVTVIGQGMQGRIN